MRSTILCCLLLAASTAHADSVNDGCENLRKKLQQFEADCPDENTEAKKIECKSKDDLNAMLKLFKTCGDKKVAKATSGKSDKQTKCRGVEVEGGAIIAEIAAPKLMECLTKVREKVAADKCGGTIQKYEFLTQTQVAGSWTKGSKSTARCPKK